MRGRLLLLCLLVCCAARAAGQTPILYPKLARLIDSLYAADQVTATIKPADSAAATYQRVIRTNLPVAKQILATYGYPSYALVGEESSKHYFLLVQHSDFDPAFQQQVLKLLPALVATHNASGRQYAFLTDRIATSKGEKQVYGTQVVMSGNTTIKPCIAPAKLNKRRQAMGLEPIEEYLQKCNALFYQMNPQQKPKPAAN